MQLRAFDELAATYDGSFTDTVYGRTLREFVWARFEPTFRTSCHILELGCGTGEDAVHLAGAGKRVVATDVSPRMIRIAIQKARGARGEELLEFHCVPMEALASSIEGQMFDGVLSNFGAVNCAPDLPALVLDIAARLEPGAPLLWVIMGRHVPWEWVWYLARGQWRKAWRRLRRGGIQWRGMTVSYPTPRQVQELLSPHFAVRRIAPLGFALPPSYAAGWLSRSPRALAVLTRIELLAQRCALLASLADHYIIEAVRLPAATAA